MKHLQSKNSVFPFSSQVFRAFHKQLDVKKAKQIKQKANLHQYKNSPWLREYESGLKL